MNPKALLAARALEAAADDLQYGPSVDELSEGEALGLTPEQVHAAKRLGMGLLDYAAFRKIRSWTDYRAYKAAKKAAANAKS